MLSHQACQQNSLKVEDGSFQYESLSNYMGHVNPPVVLNKVMDLHQAPYNLNIIINANPKILLHKVIINYFLKYRFNP
jgi:hypothetical protein